MSMEDYKREQAKKQAKKDAVRFKQDRRGKKDRSSPRRFDIWISTKSTA